MIILKPAVIGGPLWLINFYKRQLSFFYKLGLGNKTNHGVVVTDTLIQATIRRLLELEARKMIGMPVGENYYAPRR